MEENTKFVFDGGDISKNINFPSQATTNTFSQCSIVESVINSFIHRSNVGIKKYGTTMDRTDLSFMDWVQHAQEEHMDAILYLEKLKQMSRATPCQDCLFSSASLSSCFPQKTFLADLPSRATENSYKSKSNDIYDDEIIHSTK